MLKKHLHTIMLTLAAALTISLYFCNLYISDSGENVGYIKDLLCLIMLLVTTIADIVIFALSKFGFVQARVCIFNAIFLLGFQLILIWYYFAIPAVTFSPTVIFPGIACLLNALAGRRVMVREIAYTAARTIGPSKHARNRK